MVRARRRVEDNALKKSHRAENFFTAFHERLGLLKKQNVSHETEKKKFTP